VARQPRALRPGPNRHALADRNGLGDHGDPTTRLPRAPRRHHDPARVGHGGVGFGAHLRSISERNTDDIFSKVMPEDMLKFGLIPEFIGRLPVITTVRNLDREALIKILTEPRNAYVKQYQRLFELDGVELEFDTGALEAIADQAMIRGTGARGLRAIMEEVLQTVMYEVPSNPDAARVLITREVVVENVIPTIVPREFVGRRARREREEKSA